MKLTGLDRLKLALDLLNKVDSLLFSLENNGIIGDDIRDNVMEAMEQIEELIEEA